MMRGSGVSARTRTLSCHRRVHPSYLPFLLLAMFMWSQTAGAQYRYSSAPFRAGESLTYKVKWGFLRLGTIVVQQEYADPAFPRYMQVWINGESATGLPFIDVYFKSVSLLDTADPTNILYELIVDRDDRHRTSYMYDRVNDRAFAMETSFGDVLKHDTLDAPVPYFDGPGLFMYARCLAGSDTTVLLPTIMDFAMGFTSIRLSGTREQVAVAAYDDEVPAFRFSGHADWEGSAFAGMSGDFEGWVAADSAHTVLRASVGIFLGSVTIELESTGGLETTD